MTSTPSSKPPAEAGALRILLASIVDYAGLFPPAGLTMLDAVGAYDRYRRGEHAWMLGTFVVPLARMDELARTVERLPQASGSSPGPWPLSVLVSSAEEGARLLEDARTRWGSLLAVAALEVRPLDDDVIGRGHAAVPDGVDVFYEVPLDDRVEARVDAVAAVGGFAKVRTGGVSAEAFPSAAALARFLGACADRPVRFKATAGLHHAFGGRYALTYDPKGAEGRMYGFLELALVAALLYGRRIDQGEAAALLEKGSKRVELDEEVVHWGERRIASDEIARLRDGLFHSFGSCSFVEPVAELGRAGLLPDSR